jgi:four helix bundle protein
MPGYEQLMVWQRGMEFVTECYRISADFPRAEQFGLTIQLRRSATSVPANIAEGNGRWYRKEYLHHLSIARGSVREAETLLKIAVRLRYTAPGQVADALCMSDEISRMLVALRRRLSSPPPPASPSP